MFHHLAAVAFGRKIEQLALFCPSLLAVTPYLTARDSVKTFMDRVLARLPMADAGSISLEESFISLHAMLYTQSQLGRFDDLFDDFMV